MIRNRRTATALTAAVLTASALLAGCSAQAGATGPAAGAPAPTTRSAEAAFLNSYVTDAGRVVRTDQGGDTVSEGQAYALLVAVATGDRATFARVWAWTRANLLRPDWLLAWHWQHGAVVDATPAADADVDTAVALLAAARRFGNAAYRTDGRHVADAVLTYETVRALGGRVLAAGPWATGDPATVNPSYLVPGTADFLAARTADARWLSVADGTAALDAALLARYDLPPDWASVRDGSPIVDATGAPDGSTAPQYGLDATRLTVRLADSCNTGDRALAARYAGRLGAAGQPGVRSLDGTGEVGWRNAATDVAVWAADHAAGQNAKAATALSSAQQLQDSYPTYYGAAWLALGPALANVYGGHCS